MSKELEEEMKVEEYSKIIPEEQARYFEDKIIQSMKKDIFIKFSEKLDFSKECVLELKSEITYFITENGVPYPSDKECYFRYIKRDKLGERELHRKYKLYLFYKIKGMIKYT